MREIKFRAEHEGIIYNVETKIPKRSDHKGYYKQHGYIKRLVTEHPFADKRGYVMEHRLIIEGNQSKFLPKTLQVHHKDGNRSNNDLNNLEILDGRSHAKEHDSGKRNENGRFVAIGDEFDKEKFRLYDKDNNLTQIFTLRKLISTTFRRSKFEYRGKFTGLTDKNGKEIYEGDILTCNPRSRVNLIIEFGWSQEDVGCNIYSDCYRGRSYGFCLRYSDEKKGSILSSDQKIHEEYKVIGNIYENPELLNKTED